MTASALYETLMSDDTLQNTLAVAGNVYDVNAIDTRPTHTGPFIIFNWLEQDILRARVLQVWAHIPDSVSRSYDDINKILNRVDSLFSTIEHNVGLDNQRVTMVWKFGRSRDLRDPGYETITRHADYGVLYDELGA